MTKDLPAQAALELTNEEIDELVLNIPLNERRLITSSADFSVGTLVGMLRENALVIPKFQRRYIWSEKKASRLVESLILQCPIPVIYLNRRPDEVLEVVDGNQRVTSLRKYIDGNFSLSGLTAFPELDGDTYEKLSQKYQRQIRNRTIRCVIIEPESHDQVRFDVFERLNSGSTPLSPQELRHGLHYGSFVQTLEKIASDPHFAAITGMKNDKRMRRDELALRFFALHENLEAYKKPLSSFLTDYLKENKDLAESDLESKRKLFNRTLADLQALLGVNALRFRGGDSGSLKFNTAYFDAISVGYATSSLPSQINKPAPEQVKARIDALADDPLFRLHTLRATSDKAAIEQRIQAVRSAFNEFA